VQPTKSIQEKHLAGRKKKNKKIIKTKHQSRYKCSYLKIKSIREKRLNIH
jgi:hypothetical protein